MQEPRPALHSPVTSNFQPQATANRYHPCMISRTRTFSSIQNPNSWCCLNPTKKKIRNKIYYFVSSIKMFCFLFYFLHILKTITFLIFVKCFSLSYFFFFFTSPKLLLLLLWQRWYCRWRWGLLSLLEVAVR